MDFANRIYEEPFHRDSFDMLLNTVGTVSCSGDPSEYPKEKGYTLAETKLYGLRIEESDDTTIAIFPVVSCDLNLYCISFVHNYDLIRSQLWCSIGLWLYSASFDIVTKSICFIYFEYGY